MYGPRRLWLITCEVVVLIVMIPRILGWGKEGHYAVCKIAEGYLNEEAQAAVKKLLPDSAEGDLASVCSWPDEIRFHYRWSSALHYVDTPDFRCNYEYCRDCHDSGGHKDRCVTGAIYNYTMQLSTGYQNPFLESNYNLTEALMFLSHFIGDVHQPLHVGFLGDLGGNSIIVRWYRRKTNLHHVWDTMIIDSALKEFYNSDLSYMIQMIQQNITNNWSNYASSWGICTNNHSACPDPKNRPQHGCEKDLGPMSSGSHMYASESISLSCNFAYKNATPGSTLGDEYFLSRLPVVEKRLAQGGVRLAATLNRIFSSEAKVAEARR